MAVATNSTSVKTNAQSGNSHSKLTIAEQFSFPNECTNEFLDVSDTTVITCHDQVRADGATVIIAVRFYGRGVRDKRRHVPEMR